MSFLKEWNEKGTHFAQQINEMVAYAAKHGWDKVERKEISDQREHLVPDVLAALRQANKNNTVTAFRESCPPSFAPFIGFVDEQGESIWDIHFIDTDRVVFLTGSPYETRQAYLWDAKNDKLGKLDPAIVSIGRSPRENCFALASKNRIITTAGWDGPVIYEFKYPDIPITQMIPFNDGLQVMLITPNGIYITVNEDCVLIHPVYAREEEEEFEEEEDDEYGTEISMEHGALSPDNKLISFGEQGSDHRVGGNDGVFDIKPGSEYPHFTLFSKDGAQVLLNSCHMYHGATIIAQTGDLKKKPKVIDKEDRIYAGVATGKGYIWGNADGYIKAYDYKGKFLWQYYIGGTISGMAVSEDESTLYVGSYAGALHQLKLDAGHRDNHTIGTGKHYEECRWLFWKSEAGPLKW
jgi:hypothetical protein